MEGVIEVSKIHFSEEQNRALEKNLKEFYGLPQPLPLKKVLLVSKESYMRYHRKKMLSRTPFEAARLNVGEFDEKNLPFDVVKSIVTFEFPRGRDVSLIEELDKPNGMTASAVISDSGGETMEFKDYFHAEGEIVQRFLNSLKEST